MERRDDVLLQALANNANETERWQAFKAENETAIKNIDMFSKQLTVEVMVPIGNKALMPGQLIHTNELLVGHYQDYFTACSAHKAKEICRYRLRLADDHLKKLEVESDLWQNKLEKPLLEGAVPNAGEIEIVEDFVEEAHEQWLKKHKESVRKQKQKERIERESVAKGEEIFRELEERELMEELGLNVDNFDEQKLTEMFQPENEEKTRHATINVCDKQYERMTDEELIEMLNNLEAQERMEDTELDSEAEQNMQSTKDLLNSLIQSQVNETTPDYRIGVSENIEKNPSEDADSTDDDDPDQPEEVKLIRAQLAQLPNEEQQEFLSSQLQILKSKMRKLQKEKFLSDELTHLMNVVVCLEDDLQEMIYEDEQAASTDVQSDDQEYENKKNRRISFAQTDDELIFRKEESVSRMMSHKKPQSREVVELDKPLQPIQKEEKVEKPVVNSQIMQKVEQSLDFVQEHQSVQDYDLVNQILDASTGQINTLHIGFKHSNAVAATTKFDGTIPGTPADLYNFYKQSQLKQDFPIYVNSFAGEEEVKVPILKEESRKSAYDDPRAYFSKIHEEPYSVAEAAAETKSILRNKSAVELERRTDSEKQATINKSKKNQNKKKKRTIHDQLRDASAYLKVMQDLVEKEGTVPEPLPEGNYIDAHAPKKRISRFKEQRSMKPT